MYNIGSGPVIIFDFIVPVLDVSKVNSWYKSLYQDLIVSGVECENFN